MAVPNFITCAFKDLLQWRQWRKSKLFSSVIGLIFIPLTLFVFFLCFALDITSLTSSSNLLVSSSSSTSSPPSPFLAPGSPSATPLLSLLPALPPSLHSDHEIPPALPPAKTPQIKLPEVEPNKIDTQIAATISSCDIFYGSWVYDESKEPYYPVQSCPYVDEPFDCHGNGRKDTNYLKYRWKPYECDLPDFDGTTLLKLLTGKKVVIVGDSMNRSLWVSLVCLIWASLQDKSMMSGKRSVVIKNYNCSIDFLGSPFLVQRERKVGVNDTLRLDYFESTPTTHYKDVDIIVFNTGHWWTNNKVNSGRNFFKEGDHVYDKLDLAKACKKAFRTWGNWLDNNIDSKRTQVFFSGYTATHFSGRQWNSKGACLGETDPIMKASQVGHDYHWTMKILESQLKKMKTPVYYLNITRLTDYRKDAHTSVFRISPNKNVSEKERKAQDCGHWCIPGVPDEWNYLLYATLLNRHRSINGISSFKHALKMKRDVKVKM